MAFKFCCENEIRRCSDPPKDFESLIPFVNQMFIGRIPLEFTLSYVTSDGKTINIENDEIYQNLLNNKPSGNVKIFINKKEQEPVEKQDIQEEKKEEAPEQNLQETNVVTHFEQEAKEEPVAQKPEEISYASQAKATQAERIARIVQETLREDMPYIISQVKEALIKEGFNFNKLLQDNAEKGPQYQEREHDWPAHPNPYYQAPYDVVRKPVPSSAEKKPDLLGKVFEAIADLPNKATEAIGNFVEKFDGEVYVECPEGRYRKDVVDKTHQLQEVFPDENRKEILDFVKGLPKNLELDQIADMFAHRKMNSNM